jgi:hypothetical protein
MFACSCSTGPVCAVDNILSGPNAPDLIDSSNQPQNPNLVVPGTGPWTSPGPDAYIVVTPPTTTEVMQVLLTDVSGATSVTVTFLLNGAPVEQVTVDVTDKVSR